MEKRRKRRVGLVVENKKELLKNYSLAAVEQKRGKIGRIVTVIGLKRKGNARNFLQLKLIEEILLSQEEGEREESR